MKLRQAGFDEVTPSLKVSDLKGAKGTVVTVTRAEIKPGQGRKKSLLKLSMKEWPDKCYYPTPTGVSEMMKQLGDDTDNFVGERVPLHVTTTTNPETQQEVEVLHVMPASQWEEALAEVDGVSGKTSRKRKQ